MLSNRDIIRKVKGAFLPMRCAVEMWDTDSRFVLPKLRLRVFRPNDNVVETPKFVLHNLRDERELDGVLAEMRTHLQMQGLALN